jgi:uncharacterized protein
MLVFWNDPIRICLDPHSRKRACRVAEPKRLNHPWLVAVWPGMGAVALNAGIYLLAKLGMSTLAELDTGELFDVDAVEVKDGLVQSPRRPRNRFFVWEDPGRRHDLLVFVGEAQPPSGKYAFCRALVTYARGLGVERVFTFAAMATGMRPEAESRVFAAATDAANLDELKRLELHVLEGGQIGGLNGVLLSAAAEAGLHGACLLGEMPQVFAQLPFPKASHAILEAFAPLAGLDLDLAELAQQARDVEERLGEILARLEEKYGHVPVDDEGEDDEGEASYEEPESEPIAPDVSDEDRQRVEDLFAVVAQDRSKAFELKQALDRLGLFKDYEDRFLDLFKKT